MKKFLCLSLTLFFLVLPFSACSGSSGQITEIHIFAAASLQETLTELGDLYMAEHGDVQLLFNFDSSGTLKAQIEEGADCDIFISAGQKQMDQLDPLLSDTHYNILENRVVLAVPVENPTDIRSFDDLSVGLKNGSLLLAMGNSDVPAGQYAQKILTYYELSEEDLVGEGCVTFCSNVKEVTTQICEGTVDCGIIYQTDAFSAGLTVVDTATVDMCGQVIYPAAVLKTSENPDVAKAFLDFLTADAADFVFEKVGFTPIS